jgi:hypothetical protein
LPPHQVLIFQLLGTAELQDLGKITEVTRLLKCPTVQPNSAGTKISILKDRGPKIFADALNLNRNLHLFTAPADLTDGSADRKVAPLFDMGHGW